MSMMLLDDNKMEYVAVQNENARAFSPSHYAFSFPRTNRSVS